MESIEFFLLLFLITFTLTLFITIKETFSTSKSFYKKDKLWKEKQQPCGTETEKKEKDI